MATTTTSNITSNDFRGLVDALLPFSIEPEYVGEGGRRVAPPSTLMGPRPSLYDRWARMNYRLDPLVTSPNEVTVALREDKYYGKVVHTDIRCDGCQQLPLTGLRMHCAECGDTDYCLACYDAKGHCHAMRVIKRDVYERSYDF